MNQKSFKDSFNKQSQNLLARVKALTNKPLSKFALASILIALILLILGIIFGILNRPKIEPRIVDIVPLEISKQIKQQQEFILEQEEFILEQDKENEELQAIQEEQEEVIQEQEKTIEVQQDENKNLEEKNKYKDKKIDEVLEENNRLKYENLEQENETRKLKKDLTACCQPSQQPPDGSPTSGSGQPSQQPGGDPAANNASENESISNEQRKQEILDILDKNKEPSPTSGSGQPSQSGENQPPGSAQSPQSGESQPPGSAQSPQQPGGDPAANNASENEPLTPEERKVLEEELFDIEVEDIEKAESIEDLSDSTRRILIDTFRNGFTKYGEEIYPKKADDKDIEGRCISTFSVNKKGKAENIILNCFGKEKYFEEQTRKFTEDSEFKVPKDNKRRIGFPMKYHKV